MTIEPGTFTPRPGAASRGRMLVAQTAMELRLTLRNGEQLLISLLIPLMLTVVLVSEPFISVTEGRRVDFFVPGILALAVMSAAFTGQAIATGFERKYGVLKRLGGTALPRSVLLLGKTGAVCCVELIQIVVICLVGLVLAWRPHGSPLSVLLLVVLGTAAFSGLGLLMAGTLRAEATLAAANLVWFLLLFFGGVMFPLSKFPHTLGQVLQYLPIAALSDGLRAVLRAGSGPPVHDLVTLLVWAALTLAAATATFRWD
ncbi:MAG TPA: ABC transporter permease [Mycobacteriales bacterium]|nr:ABC transporter permease [Mycobacteriales bacterium]